MGSQRDQKGGATKLNNQWTVRIVIVARACLRGPRSDEVDALLLACLIISDPSQPMKHSIAQLGELKATFSTGLGRAMTVWPVSRGSYGR